MRGLVAAAVVGADNKMGHRPKRTSGAAPAEAPAGLRAVTLELSGSEYVVLSYPASAPPPIPGLSAAESEVLRAAVSGLTNAEIAAGRDRSVFTIQNQLAAACRKLGVSSRAEATAKLARLGLQT